MKNLIISEDLRVLNMIEQYERGEKKELEGNRALHSCIYSHSVDHHRITSIVTLYMLITPFFAYYYFNFHFFFLCISSLSIHIYIPMIMIMMIILSDLVQSSIFRDGCQQSFDDDIDIMGDLDFDFIHGMMTDDFIEGEGTSGYGRHGGGSSSNERQQYDDVFDDSNRMAFEHTYEPISNQSHHQHHHHHHHQEPVIRVNRNLQSFLPNRRSRSSSMSSSSNNYHMDMFDSNYFLASASSPLGTVSITSIVVSHMLITPIYAYYCFDYYLHTTTPPRPLH